MMTKKILKYYHLYDEICDLTLDELLTVISKSKRLKLGDARLIDLIIDGKAHNGIYVFFSKSGKVEYIGKTISRVLVERIAAHFDTRSEAFMNSFLCALAGWKKSRNGRQATTRELENIYPKALNYSMVFISISNRKKTSRLEGILMREYQPRLNSITSKKEYTKDILIKKL